MRQLLTCSTAEMAALARAYPEDVGFCMKCLSSRSESANDGNTLTTSCKASSLSRSSVTQSRRAEMVSRSVDGWIRDERKKRVPAAVLHRLRAPAIEWNMLVVKAGCSDPACDAEGVCIRGPGGLCGQVCW